MDDSNIVIRDIRTALVELDRAFCLLRKACNLRINYIKTYCIPLAAEGNHTAANAVIEFGRGWQSIVTTNCCKLLGMWVGPGATEMRRWIDPLLKHAQRISRIRSFGLSIPRSSVLYNQSALSV